MNKYNRITEDFGLTTKEIEVTKHLFTLTASKYDYCKLMLKVESSKEEKNLFDAIINIFSRPTKESEANERISAILDRNKTFWTNDLYLKVIKKTFLIKPRKQEDPILTIKQEALDTKPDFYTELKNKLTKAGKKYN